MPAGSSNSSLQTSSQAGWAGIGSAVVLHLEGDDVAVTGAVVPEAQRLCVRPVLPEREVATEAGVRAPAVMRLTVEGRSVEPRSALRIAAPTIPWKRKWNTRSVITVTVGSPSRGGAASPVRRLTWISRCRPSGTVVWSTAVASKVCRRTIGDLTVTKRPLQTRPLNGDIDRAAARRDLAATPSIGALAGKLAMRIAGGDLLGSPA